MLYSRPFSDRSRSRESSAIPFASLGRGDCAANARARSATAASSRDAGTTSSTRRQSKARDFSEETARRAAELAAGSTRPGAGARGVALTPLRREVEGDTTRYEHVRVVLDRDSGTATITISSQASASS